MLVLVTTQMTRLRYKWLLIRIALRFSRFANFLGNDAFALCAFRVIQAHNTFPRRSFIDTKGPSIVCCQVCQVRNMDLD